MLYEIWQQNLLFLQLEYTYLVTKEDILSASWVNNTENIIFSQPFHSAFEIIIRLSK